MDYVSNGVVSPIWSASEKINLSMLFSSSGLPWFGFGVTRRGPRHDKLFADRRMWGTRRETFYRQFFDTPRTTQFESGQFEYNDIWPRSGSRGNLANSTSRHDHGGFPRRFPKCASGWSAQSTGSLAFARREIERLSSRDCPRDLPQLGLDGPAPREALARNWRTHHERQKKRCEF